MKYAWILAIVLMVAGCGESEAAKNRREAEKAAEVKGQVQPGKGNVPAREGIAMVVLLDTSGSMEGSKLETAKGCVVSIVKQAEEFSTQRSVPVELAVFGFSSVATEIVPMGKPNADRAARQVKSMVAGGSTGIGDAVTRASRLLNESGYSAKHVLVVTDGENTAGTPPEEVARAFKSLSPELRPSVYLVAFDVDAAVFNKVKEAGWPVYSATNAAQLRATLDEVVGGEILLEK